MPGSEDYWISPSPKQILGLWQWVHQELTDAQQASFLVRPETLALSRMRSDVVEAAIRQAATLDQILKRAAAMEERRAGTTPEAAPTPSIASPPSPTRGERTRQPSPPSTKVKKRKQATQKSRTTRKKDAASGNGPPPSNTFQHTSERYAGAMRHTPVEATPVERCEACGAAVPVGTSHDCW